MSIFCCYRTQRTAGRETGQDVFELPIRPPRVKLSSTSFPTSGFELPPPEIVAKETPSLSHNQIQEATVDPTIIEIEDSDDDELVRSTRNSSTGTLGAIRTKFIRRLSQKSESKRHSQQSLGTSDGEIARRAELKRLMRKRIQEELKSEKEQEEVETKTGNTEESKPCSTANVGFPRGGPRDNIEFCVLDVSETSPRDNDCGSPGVMLLALPASRSQPGISLRRCSYPGSGSASRAHDGTSLEGRGAVRARNSLPRFPSSPQLTPVHIPSDRGSESLCSWRLSYSAEQLARYIGVPEAINPDETYELAEINTRDGIIDREDESMSQVEDNLLCIKGPATNDEPGEDRVHDKLILGKCQQHIQSDTENSESLYSGGLEDTSFNQDSPLDIWLRSQELQSASTTPSRKTSDMVQRIVPESSGVSGPQNALDSVSGMRHSPLEVQPRNSNEDTRVELVEMLSNWPSELQQLQRSMRRPSDAFDGQGLKPIDQPQEASSSFYASSRYTTKPNSFQNVEKESRLSLMEFLGGRKMVAPFLGLNRFTSSNRTTDAEKSDVSSYKTAPNNASALDVAIQGTRQIQRPTAETNSAAVSDTASFRQRETELRSIEKRFGRTHPRRDTTAPMVSKFREEFSEPRTRTSIISKNSILAKFHLQIHKIAKYPTPDLRRYSVRDTKCRSEPNLDAEGARLGQHKEPEDVANSVDPRQQTAVFDGHIPKIRRQEVNSLESLGYQKTTHIDHILHPKPRKEQGSSLKPPSRHENNRSQQSDISSTVLREWVNLMNDQDLKPQDEPKTEPQSHALWRFRTPPASWAKWPSHTRQQRTGPAGEEDNVIPRDFAVRVESNGSGTTWSTDRLGESSKRHVTPTRSLSAQLGRVVKGGLSRVVHGTLNRASSETYHTRQKLDGHLEYPELEILPIQGGYEDLQALEQQIDTMKRGSAAAESQLASLGMDNMRPPLSARLAEEVHMIQHKVPREGFQDDEAAVQNSLIIPITTLVQAKPTPQRITVAASRSRAPGSYDSDELRGHEQRPENNIVMAEDTRSTRAV
ncbi:hypothetical protein F4813DRAFT_387841 [Daldinia decipiens]|uniref:uncharacterized protein n=1 Tax=Daldinia decipiens TaxID=326647 RepID=UPI0020C40581|nr:uncharacterized protein F4813DRAFT_387841 [Daldinia decipiens]KAI1659131.1 hypothetical protein F4813DRAFT_387841 [Daldinia decipiens]